MTNIIKHFITFHHMDCSIFISHYLSHQHLVSHNMLTIQVVRWTLWRARSVVLCFTDAPHSNWTSAILTVYVLQTLCQQAQILSQFLSQLRNLLVMERTFVILHLIILPIIINHLNVRQLTLHVPPYPCRIYIHHLCNRLGIIIGNHFNDSHRLIHGM